MNLVLRLYAWILQLYPPRFRHQFGAEMAEVFREALEDALRRGGLSMASFLTWEAVLLPGSLAKQHVYAAMMSKQQSLSLSAAGGGEMDAQTGRAATRLETLLAGLPLLLLGMFLGIPALLFAVGLVDRNLTGDPAAILLWSGLFVILMVGMVVYSLRHGWRRWTASWYLFLPIIPIVFLMELSARLFEIPGSVLNFGSIILFFVLPLAMAYLLYKVACRDRLAGLIAAIPVMGVICVQLLEFVAEPLRGLVWASVVLVSGLAAMLALHAKKFGPALAGILLVPLVAGIFCVLIGTYYGKGAAPYNITPRFLEMLDLFFINLGVMAPIALGPQLARIFRSFGAKSSSQGGVIFARLALLGVLLALILVVFLYARNFTGFYGLIISSPYYETVRIILTVLAPALYVVGFALTIRASFLSGALSARPSQIVRLAMLFVLLPGLIPLLVLPSPPGDLQAIFLNSTAGAWQAAVLAWIALSAWLVAKGDLS